MSAPCNLLGVSQYGGCPNGARSAPVSIPRACAATSRREMPRGPGDETALGERERLRRRNASVSLRLNDATAASDSRDTRESPESPGHRPRGATASMGSG